MLISMLAMLAAAPSLDPKLSAKVDEVTPAIVELRHRIHHSVGEAGVQLMEPIAGAKDFSYFAREAPGFFYFLGSTRPGTTSGDHHTPTFMADDSAIPLGIRTMCLVLLDYLQRESGR